LSLQLNIIIGTNQRIIVGGLLAGQTQRTFEPEDFLTGSRRKMSGKRIGERLSRVAQLSGHDIEEILSEQRATGLRFGEIALQLGLCSAQDVLRAWSSQLKDSPQRIDLEKFGIDSQAVEHLPAEFAVQYHVMPVRILENELVVAIDEAAFAIVSPVLSTALGREVKFVLCTHRQIAAAIRSYYSRQTVAA
jgi:hypothetical protein